MPPYRETDSRLDWLQEHAGVMQKLIFSGDTSIQTDRHSRNRHRTDKILSTKTSFAQFCHASFIHSSLLVCSWHTFLPTHSKPVCCSTLISAIPLIPLITPTYSPLSAQRCQADLTGPEKFMYQLVIGKAKRVLAPGENSSINKAKMRCEHVSEQIFSENCEYCGSTHSEQMELNLMTTAYHLELPM